MAIFVVTETLTGENQWSEAVKLQGHFNLSLTPTPEPGSWDATVHIQRSFDKGSTWKDVEKFTEVPEDMNSLEEFGIEPEGGVFYRFGIKDGNYSKGTIIGRMSQ